MSFLSFLFGNDKKKEDQFNKNVSKATGDFLGFLRDTKDEAGKVAAKIPDMAVDAINTGARTVSRVADEAANPLKYQQMKVDKMPDGPEKELAQKQLNIERFDPRRIVTQAGGNLVNSAVKAVAQAPVRIALSGAGAIERAQGHDTIEGIDPNKNRFGDTLKALIGEKEVKGLSDYGKDVPIVGDKLKGNNAWLAPVFGAAMTAGDVAFGGKGEGASTGIRSVEEGLNLLSKASTAKTVTGVLGKIKGLSDDVVKELAPQIAKMTDKKQIHELVRNGIRQSNEVVDTAAKAPGIVDNVTAPVVDGATKAMDAIKSPTLPEGPVNVTEQVLKTLGDQGVEAPERIKNALISADQARTSAPKTDFLEAFKAPAKVLTSHFGKVGGDIAYEWQKGAKVVQDGREKMAPILDEADKIFSSIAKSATGKKDVSARILKALEDRENVGNYIQSPEEMKLFQHAADIFDAFKKERESRGLAVIGENYSPRAAIQNALEAPERLLNNVTGGIGRNLESGFSKQRKSEDLSREIDNTNIVDLLRRYTTSQLKEFGFKPAMDHLVENIDKVNPVYTANGDYARQGQQYLTKMIKTVLDPQQTTGWERALNKGLQTTYKNALSYNPRFILQNSTQRWINKADVAKEGIKVAKNFDDETKAVLREGLASGDNPLFSELSSLENSGVKLKKPGRFNISNKTEMKNITQGYEYGAGQAIAESDIYKEAIKGGAKPADAIRAALADPATKELAMRRGNVVVNMNQFGANIMTKPEFFRDQGSWLGIPKSFFKQYGRFQAGMIENLSKVMNIKNARESDILMRGNPLQTNIVEYKKSAEAALNATEDLLKAAKNGEIQGVAAKDVKLFQKQLHGLVGQLDEGIKDYSKLRKGKTIKQAAKMWGAATGIQFLFSGDQGTTEERVAKSAAYGSPVNVPQKDDIPIPFVPPSIKNLVMPGKTTKQRVRAAANFVPGVGLVINRANDFNRFAKTIKSLGE